MTTWFGLSRCKSHCGQLGLINYPVLTPLVVSAYEQVFFQNFRLEKSKTKTSKEKQSRRTIWMMQA